jgi:hypothetical protein
MEAATPLRTPRVRVVADRVQIDDLLVEDECAVRLVRDREENGEDAVKAVIDAIEIGARVLDREQAAANAEFVKAEFEKVSRSVETEFADRARAVSEGFERQISEVFGPESGHLAKALDRHFSDESSTAVQHRVRALVAEVMAQSRTDLLRQFSGDDAANPLAGFQKATLAIVRDASERQDKRLHGLLQQMAALQLEVQRLRDADEAGAELAEERERGTAKGRTYEEAVFAAVDALADAQGDDCDAVGDTAGPHGKKGDVVVGIEGAYGPARGRIVFEAKDRKLSKPAALGELDGALAAREADYAVLVVPSEDELPARTRQLREISGDKMFVVYDPADDAAGRLSLEVAYALARARVAAKRGGAEGVDTAAMGELVERATASLDQVRTVKSHLTKAKGSIDEAHGLVEAMAATVREHLDEIDRLARAGAEDDGSAQRPAV